MAEYPGILDATPDCSVFRGSAGWGQASCPTGQGWSCPLRSTQRRVQIVAHRSASSVVTCIRVTTGFDGLWHGRRLAYTVACATVVLAGAFRLGADASEE
jgi:hypothetical protein